MPLASYIFSSLTSYCYTALYPAHLILPAVSPLRRYWTLRLEISPRYTQHTIATHCHTGIDATSLHSMFVSSVLSVSDISPQLLQEISIILHHVLDGQWSNNIPLQAPNLWHISVIINLYIYVYILHLEFSLDSTWTSQVRWHSSSWERRWFSAERQIPLGDSVRCQI